MQLLEELYIAYFDAIRHKKRKPYVRRFAKNLHENLCALRDELQTRTYKAHPSTCFIITNPKQREVFASDFRDRIVHHFFFNRTHQLFERYFIHDSYSCIEGRGTLFGIDRLRHHILSESRNRTYISNQSLRRMRQKTYNDQGSVEHLHDAMNSRFGILSHYKSYNIRTRIFTNYTSTSFISRIEEV